MGKQFGYFVPVLALILSGCFETRPSPWDPDPDYGVDDQEIWELTAAGCDADSRDALGDLPALRLTLGQSSSSARVTSATYPQVVCITQQTITYPTSTTMRFVDGAIDCHSSSATEYYPWGEGPEDVTFDFTQNSNVLVLSRPEGDAGCAIGQTYNYVFVLLAK